MLRLLDRTRHLRTYIAAAHALEVAPGVDADFVLKPALERLRKGVTVSSIIRNENAGSSSKNGRHALGEICLELSPMRGGCGFR